MSAARLVLPLLTAALLLAPPAHAQPENLLPNPDFDHDLSGWVPNVPELAFWHPIDVEGDPGSGSALLRRGALLLTASGIPVVAGERYRLAGHAVFGAHDTGDGAFFHVRWHGPACLGPLLREDTFGRLVGQPGEERAEQARAFVAPAAAACAIVGLSVAAVRPTTFEAHFDKLRFEPYEPTCEPEETALCLNGGRYRVEVSWQIEDGGTGSGHAVPLTADSGAFWFFGPDNLELMVKVLNGCPVNGRVWIFAAGLTNVEVEVTVTDTVTLEVLTYRNPQGTPFRPIQDTLGFLCS
jgi:hypothetical protein